MPSLTVTFPASGPLGFGMFLAGITSGGTFSPGDVVTVILRPAGAANKLCQGDQVLSSGVVWHVNLLTHVQNLALQGDAVDVDLLWNGSGGLVDSQTITGTYVNDSITGLGPLIAALSGGGGGHDPMLDAILAAVRRDFPVTS